MAVCPKCGKEIEHLRNYALMWRELQFSVEDGKPVHEPSGDIIFSDPLEEEYVCPECDTVLFKAEKAAQVKETEQQAKAFLTAKEE